MGGRTSTITLKALTGAPLADDALRAMVVATARAIAERQGIAVGEIETTPAAITVSLACGRIEAIGFAVELRRLTTRWYTAKYGAATLWGEPPAGAGDEAESWRQG